MVGRNLRHFWQCRKVVKKNCVVIYVDNHITSYMLLYLFEHVVKALQSGQNNWQLWIVCEIHYKFTTLQFLSSTIWHQNFATSFATISNGWFFFLDAIWLILRCFCICVTKCSDTCHKIVIFFCVPNLCVVNSGFSYSVALSLFFYYEFVWGYLNILITEITLL